MNHEYEIKHFERNEFKPDEIIHFLAKHGTNIDIDGYEGHPEIVPANVPEWKRIMSLEPLLSVDHITHAFIDIDPYVQSAAGRRTAWLRPLVNNLATWLMADFILMSTYIKVYAK